MKASKVRNNPGTLHRLEIRADCTYERLVRIIVIGFEPRDESALVIVIADSGH
jgi:hypothetical protein